MATTKDNKSEATVTVAKTPAELQRMRLEKLMKNPAKAVYIPEASKSPKMKEPPEFIRNVWGSSAGAGSGDFHVYRGVRRREYARQKFINELAKVTTADDRYHQKVEENKKVAEERTAKKRAKRQKKKSKAKNKKMKKEDSQEEENSSEEDTQEDEATGPANQNESNGQESGKQMLDSHKKKLQAESSKES